MKHVALIIPTLDRIGGAERQTLLLAGRLRQRGWRVSVLALSGNGGNAAPELMVQGVAFLSLGMRRGLADPRGWIRYHRWLRIEQPEVVHAHLPHATWLARWSRLAAPSRVLLDTLHSSATGTGGRKLGYRLSDWLTDRVTAVSRATAEGHLAAHMVNPGKLSVLPNGINLDKWRPNREARPSIRRELGIQEEFLWFAAGRLEPVKDYPTLLRALVDLPEPFRLVIAGIGSLHQELQSLARHLRVLDRVTFLGFESNVLRWMQAADGFVLCSRWEGLPMALIEACACALPAVITDVPGTQEVLPCAQSGLLVAAGDASALHAAMTQLMEMPLEEQQALGRRARRKVQDSFSLEHVVDQWEQLYRTLLEQNPRPTHSGLRSGSPLMLSSDRLS